MTNLLTFIVSFFTITLLIVCSGFTFSWMSQSTAGDVDQIDGTIESVKDLYISEYKVYRYSDDEKAGILDESTNITLSAYDTVFTDRNENNPLIIKIIMEGVTITNGASFSITIDSTESLYVDDTVASPVINAALSNIIKINCAMISSLDTETDANTIYTTSKNFFADTTNTYQSGQFVTINNSTLSKTTSITLSFSGYTASNNIVLYLELNYDDDLVNQFLQNTTGGTQITASAIGQEIDFASDLSTLVFNSLS